MENALMQQPSHIDNSRYSRYLIFEVKIDEKYLCHLTNGFRSVQCFMYSSSRCMYLGHHSTYQRHESNRRYSYPPQIVLTADQDDGSVGAELEDLLVPECSAVLQRLQPRDVVAEQDHVTPADILTILHTKCSFHFSYFS